MLDAPGLEALQKQSWGIKAMNYQITTVTVEDVPEKAVMLQPRNVWVPMNQEITEECVE